MTSLSAVRPRAPHWLRLAAGCMAAALLLVQPAPAQVGPGDTPSYTWSKPLLDGLGTSKLEELRGKLVWIEFWGTH